MGGFALEETRVGWLGLLKLISTWLRTRSWNWAGGQQTQRGCATCLVHMVCCVAVVCVRGWNLGWLGLTVSAWFCLDSHGLVISVSLIGECVE
jgi:hypothetical protein